MVEDGAEPPELMAGMMTEAVMRLMACVEVRLRVKVESIWAKAVVPSVLLLTTISTAEFFRHVPSIRKERGLIGKHKSGSCHLLQCRSYALSSAKMA